MKLLAAVTAVPVAATSVATGDLIYLVYIVAVLYAIFGWTPSWRSASMSRPTRHIQVPAGKERRMLTRARR